MNKTQHTEIPFEVYNPPDYEFLHQTIHICLIVKKNRVIAELRDREHGLADARFIVHCCNNHAKLVEALKECIAYFREKIVTSAIDNGTIPYFQEYKNAVLLLAQLDKDGE